MKIYAFVTFFLFSIVGFSQNKLNFEFDYAQFGYNTTSNFVEFYYSINQNTLSVKKTDSLNYSEGILQVVIKDTLSGDLIIDKKWIISQPVTNDQNANKNLVGVLGFILAPGLYNCSVVVTDAVDANRYKSITEVIQVNVFQGNTLSMADVQLASNIIPESENTSSIFYKNTYEIIPIPTCTFGEGQPVLYYYTEIYNIENSTNKDALRIDEQIFNSRGQIVSNKSKQIGRNVESRVEVGTVMTYKLPTDTYTIVLALIDSSDNYGVSSSKKFYVYNPSVAYVDTFKTQETNIVGGMFGVMSDEELDDFFAKSKYVAKDSEIDTYNNLTSESAKREFLSNFWKARDEDPSNDENRNLMNYIGRIEESNQNFNALGKEGWKTDRGRVYIIYGPPSEINRYPNEAETRPYERWSYYDIEGGVEFIFGDITGFSNYRLIHSTKRGEMNDPNWQRRIRVQ